MGFVIIISALLPLDAVAFSTLSPDQSVSLPHLKIRETSEITESGESDYCQDHSIVCGSTSDHTIDLATGMINPDQHYFTDDTFVSAFHLPTNAYYDADPRAGARMLASAYAHTVSLLIATTKIKIAISLEEI